MNAIFRPASPARLLCKSSPIARRKYSKRYSLAALNVSARNFYPRPDGRRRAFIRTNLDNLDSSGHTTFVGGETRRLGKVERLKAARPLGTKSPATNLSAASRDIFGRRIVRVRSNAPLKKRRPSKLNKLLAF